MDELNINNIRELLMNDKVAWSQHMVIRMQKRGIALSDVEQCIHNGEIIEQYKNDYPYTSCLILGTTKNKQGIHVVCGIGEGKLWMITAYYPDAYEWYDDLRTRRR